MEYFDLVMKLKVDLDKARSKLDTISHSHFTYSGEPLSLWDSLSSETQVRENLKTKKEMTSVANSNLKENAPTLKTESAELRVQL